MEEKKLYNAVRKIITLADGRQIEIETGKLAKQADGSVVVKMGDTMLLGTVVAAKDAKPDTDFMPLQVEYKEKYAAVGRFPGGFMKREARANDSEVLVARLIDRALRPLFPADYHAEVYVTVNLISADKDIQPDALSLQQRIPGARLRIRCQQRITHLSVHLDQPLPVAATFFDERGLPPT